MLFSIEHYESRIEETKAALQKYTAAADQDQSFIEEFAVSDPETAEVYRQWKKFNLGKVSYFQTSLAELNTNLMKLQLPRLKD